MKLRSLILCLLLAACSACSTPAPVPPAPPPPVPPPAPVVVGLYTIREYDVNGNVRRAYSGITAYKERSFPRSVTFEYQGELVTLTSSYQISRVPAK